nr:hypothetical protein Cplu_66 [Cedratvirus plubellavi]
MQPEESLLGVEQLYQRRLQVLSLLNDPANFARKAYLVGAMGNVVSTPFGFSDNTSPLPSDEQVVARDLCKVSSSRQVVPYVYYLPLSQKYSLIPSLCNCLEAKVTSQLVCDNFTHKVLLAYLVDYFCREGGIENYRIYYTSFFCSGAGNVWKERIEEPPLLDEANLYSLVFSVKRILDFLWERTRFATFLTPNNIVYASGQYKIDAFSRAEAVIFTNEGMCLLAKKRKPSVEILLSSSPYYYYSRKKRMPGSIGFYSFLLSLLLQEEIRNMFFSTSWGEELWFSLFEQEDAEKLFARLSSASDFAQLVEGVGLRCKINSTTDTRFENFTRA